MNSFLFRTGARGLLAPLLLLSLWLLYRGHNLPGGGFIAGLVAATAFLLIALAESPGEARRRLRVGPGRLIAVGLLVAAASGLPGLLHGFYMDAAWLPAFSLPLLGTVHLGTPVLFDVGVFLAVAGFVLLVTLQLLERS